MADFYPISPIPFQVTNPDTGALASNFTLYAYLAGTTTPTALYSDGEGTSLGTSVSTNSAGYFVNGSDAVTNVYLSKTVDYKFILRDNDAGLEWTIDDIPSFLGAAVDTPSFDTFADLRLGTGTEGFAFVGGAITKGDGGHGTFWFDTSDTTTADNGGTVIVDAGSPRVGCWKRLITGARTNVNWFGVTTGASGWSSSRMTAAIAWAVDNGNILYFPGDGTTYQQMEPFAITHPNTEELVIEGDGKTNTVFQFTTAAGTSGDPFITVDVDGISADDRNDIRIKNAGFIMGTGTGNEYDVLKITGTTASFFDVIFEDCFFDNTASIVEIQNPYTSTIRLNDCSYAQVDNVIASATSQGQAKLSLHSCSLKESLANFITMGSGVCDHVEITDFDMDNKLITAGLVNLNSNGSIINNFSVMIDGVKMDNSSSNKTFLNLLNISATVRGKVSIKNCHNIYDVNDGVGNITIDSFDHIEINNCQFDDLTLTDTGSCNITSCDWRNSTINANAAQELTIMSSSHLAFTPSGGSAVAANANFIGGDTVFTGTLTYANGGPVEDVNVTKKWFGGITGGPSSASSISLPSGWSVARQGVGQYRVTHDIGTTSILGTVSVNGPPSGTKEYVTVMNPVSTTTFDIYLYAADTGVADDGASIAFQVWTY